MATLASAALLLGSTLSATPAHAAPDDGLGEITVKLLDHLGKPINGMVMGSSVGESFTFPESEGGPFTAMSSSYTGSVPTGRYGLMAIAPWGGLVCAGIAPCVPPGMGPGVTPVVPGVVTVTDDGPAVSYTIRFPAPVTVSGSRKIGGVLRANVSSAQQSLLGSFSMIAPGLITNQLVMQWRRNGVAIPGATGTAYRLKVNDANRKIDLVLNYPELLRLYLASAGFPLTPYIVAAGKAGKAATKTTASLLRSRVVTGRSASVRIDVTAGRTAVTGGKVRITVGKWKATKTVRNGVARAALPRNLKPGRYRVIVKYLGSKTHQASKARPKIVRIVQK